MSATITFTPDGYGHCLYTEDIDLASIGPLEIKRATNIEYNDASQQWEVRMADDPDPDILFCSGSRQACLDWEHDHVDRLMLINRWVITMNRL